MPEQLEPWDTCDTYMKAYQDQLCQLPFLLGMSRGIQLQNKHRISTGGKYLSCY